MWYFCTCVFLAPLGNEHPVMPRQILVESGMPPVRSRAECQGGLALVVTYFYKQGSLRAKRGDGVFDNPADVLKPTGLCSCGKGGDEC